MAQELFSQQISGFQITGHQTYNGFILSVWKLGQMFGTYFSVRFQDKKRFDSIVEKYVDNLNKGKPEAVYNHFLSYSKVWKVREKKLDKSILKQVGVKVGVHEK